LIADDNNSLSDEIATRKKATKPATIDVKEITKTEKAS